MTTTSSLSGIAPDILLNAGLCPASTAPAHPESGTVQIPELMPRATSNFAPPQGATVSSQAKP